MKEPRGSRRRLTTLCGVTMLAATLAIAADDATPTPEPTPTPRPTTSGTRSLAEVARETRLQGTDSGSQPIVISNENLADLAAKGELTHAGPTPTATALPGSRRPVHAGVNAAGAVVVKPNQADLAGLDAGAEDRRRHWRGLYLKQIETLEQIHKQIEVLDAQIPGLWSQFYAWDDPVYRDGVIKPKLDAALAMRQQLEEQLAQEEERLPEILDNARRDGALPGWFRDLPQPTPSTSDEREEWGVPSTLP